VLLTGRGFDGDDQLPRLLDYALHRAGVAPHRSGTVLVVDDDPATARLVHATLAGLGYRAVCRADGESGLAAIPQERPDVILLDLIMPVLDGFQFLDRLRLMPGPHPPVIVWTNKDLTAAERDRCWEPPGRPVQTRFHPEALLEQLRLVAG
jgi:CheY-like chemotaxis protein